MGKVTLVQTEAFLSLCLENRGRFDTWLLRACILATAALMYLGDWAW